MSDAGMDFRPSAGASVGVELELQILNSRDFNLARDAADLIALIEKNGHPGAVKPEITESMVELNTSIHTGHETLVKELQVLRDSVSKAADRSVSVAVASSGIAVAPWRTTLSTHSAFLRAASAGSAARRGSRRVTTTRGAGP